MIPLPHGETVTRLRPGTRTDRTGNTVPDHEDPTSTTIDGCAVWSGATTDPLLAGRELALADFTVAMPAGTDIKPDDRLTIRGNTCDVVGVPFDWVNPFTGWTPGLVVQANLAKG